MNAAESALAKSFGRDWNSEGDGEAAAAISAVAARLSRKTPRMRLTGQAADQAGLFDKAHGLGGGCGWNVGRDDPC
jgi:hypothetical protein